MNRILILLLLIPFQLQAIELKPFGAMEISEESWQRYHTEVNSRFGHTSRIHSIQKIITYTDDHNRISFSFTIDGHPAHPSWITRQMVQIDGSVDVRQIGHFAGDEESFALLFKQYQKLNEHIKNSAK